MWERALRRAELPVAYTEGFSPRPKLHFGLALSDRPRVARPSTSTSTSAPASTPVDLDDAARPRSRRRCPSASTCTPPSAARPARRRRCSRPSPLHVADRASSASTADAARDAVAAALGAADARRSTRERKGQRGHRRPPARHPRPRVVGPSAAGDRRSRAELATQPRGAAPERAARRVLPDASTRSTAARVLRTHQWIDRDGARASRAPRLGAGATSPPHASERVRHEKGALR